MERNMVLFAGIVAALFISASLITSAVSAHMYDNQADYEKSDFREHYKEMLDLQEQYFNGDISFEEFEEKMMSDESYGERHPCHAGSGMMGLGMMGWR